MVKQKTENQFSQQTLLVGLMVISTLLFAIGIALERSGEAAEAPGAHTEVQSENRESAAATETHTEGSESAEAHEEGGESTEAHEEGGETAEAHEEGSESAEAHEESSESAEAHEEGAVTETPHSETILGIDLENPLFVVGAVAVWLVLAAAVWFYGRPVLLPILVVAIGTTLFDAMEVVTQLNRSNTGIALLAAVIAVLHAAVAVIAGRVLFFQNPSTTVPSSQTQG